MERIVLVYSGGEASAAAMRSLAVPGREVVTLTVDVGQARELTGVRERALAGGAVRAHVIDARDEFATAYLWTSVQAGLTGTARQAAMLSLPLVARKLVEVARIERASAVAHEWSGADGDVFARLVRALDPAMSVHSIEPTAAPRETESTLWSRTFAESSDGFLLTRDPAACGDEAAMLDVEFVGGVPVRVNGIDMDFVELVESVETIAGAHGVGRLPAVNGARGRRIEAPAAVVLEAAYRACERAALSDEAMALRKEMAAALERFVSTGRWFTVECGALRAFVAALQPSVRGAVRLALHQGDVTVTAVRASAAEGSLAVGAR